MCEQELVKSRLRVNAASVSVRNKLVTVCVWLSSSWDLRLSADKLTDHEQQAKSQAGLVRCLEPWKNININEFEVVIAQIC